MVKLKVYKNSKNGQLFAVIPKRKFKSFLDGKEPRFIRAKKEDFMF